MNLKISLRPAEEKDCRLLWKWRNEKSVRKVSFNSKYIPYKEHKKWFGEKLKDKNTKILIIQDGSAKEIGEVKFDFDSKNKAEASIIIDKKERGKGYGAKVLKLSSRCIFKNFPIKEIIAYVKRENIISFKTFRKAGFINTGLKEIKGFVCHEMILKND